MSTSLRARRRGILTGCAFLYLSIASGCNCPGGSFDPEVAARAEVRPAL
ncbi:MAG: hypothetical protein M3547_11200 [Acidobacteriota bacterium]|nr:hypothetical protein [Acidobacteriota bacterium]